MKKFLILGFLIASTVLLTGCVSSNDKSSSSSSTNNSSSQTGQKVEKCTNEVIQKASRSYSTNCILADKEITGKKAVVETDQGTFEFEFLEKQAPKTVSNFVFLAGEGFYNDLTFHRRDDSISIVQGGDPKGNGTGGPGYSFEEEPPQKATDYKKGVVAMAKTQAPKSTGSQFFIMLDDFAGFNPEYSIFGQVTKGMENVQKIKVGTKIISVKIQDK